MNKLAILFFAVLTSLPTSLTAQTSKQDILDGLHSQRDHYTAIASQLWEQPELGYREEKSAALLQAELRREGFTVVTGVAGIPTAFTATFGSGKPVLGLLGEFDALPGMSQAAVPYRQPLVEGGPGQACGHHLYGTGSMAAAIAVKNWLLATGTPGTIRFYGTPAEEGGSGKVYMVRAGLFDDLDLAMYWHASDSNSANPATNLATISAKFRFRGVSAHAAMAPEMGRSALDAVEAMNHMVNLLREHTTEPTRIHYVITKGGDAPNIVPEFAESYYVVRHEEREELGRVWARVIQAAQGAATGTATEMSYEIIGGTYNKLPNEALALIIHANLESVGGVVYSTEDIAFAEQISKTLSHPRPIESAAVVEPMVFTYGKASADSGDVSWRVPLSTVETATWVPGTPPHSWQAVAAGGMSIGYKGMLVAAKSLAGSAFDIFTDPSLLEAVRKEFDQRRGPDFKYEALLGDREPPLDYRQ